MPIVGEADVIITAVTTQLEAKIREALDNMAHDAEHGGGDAGDKWGSGFEDGSNSHFKNILDQMGMGLSSGGLHEGESYGHNVAQGISHGLGVTDRDIDNLGQKLANAGEGAGDSIARDVERGLGDAKTAAGSGGDDIGKAVSDGISSGASAIGDWASILKIGALVAAIGLAVGAIANLVAGLFAVVAAAAPAAAALAAFLPIAGGLVFTLGTAALGFMGVFKAVSALNKEQNAGGQSARSFAQQQQAAADRVISAREAVQRAEQALSTAQQSAADDRVSQAHAVEQAELALQRAQQNETQAQKDLIAARQQAANQLVQLSFQTRQAGISEREASLALADAQLKFQETISDPRSTARAREDAALAVQQAQLNLDEASQRNLDAKKAQNQADKEGVNGSAAVVQAQQRVKDAHQSVIDQEYNLAHLRHANAEQAVRDQQAIQNAIQGVADAQRGLKEALQAQKDAVDGVGGAANAANQALKNLSPQAIAFAKYLVSLKPLFLELQGAASGMFAPVESGIKAIISSFFPTLVAGVKTTSTAIGDAFEYISKHFIATPLFNSQFRTLIGANAGGLRDMAVVITNLLKAFTQLAVDAIPLAQRFTDWLVSLTGRFDNFVRIGSVGGNDSPIVKFFKLAGDRAALVGDIIKQIIRIFFDWGKGADATGLGLLETFDKVAKKFADGLGSKEGQKKLHDFFAAVEPGFKALMSLIGAILGAFINLATSPGLKTVADQLRTGLLPMLQHLIDYLNTSVAPKIVPILTDIGRVIMNIVNSGVLQTVIRDLGAMIHVIAGFAENPIVGVLIGHMGNLLAAFIAFKVIQKFSPFDEFARGIVNFKKGLDGALSGSTLAKTKLGQIASGFREIQLAQEGATTAGTNLSLGQKITAFTTGRKTPTADLKGEGASAASALESVIQKGGIFTRIGGAITATLEGVGSALGALFSPIGLVIGAIALLVGSFIYAYKTSAEVRKNVSEIFAGLKKAAEAFIKPIEKIFGDVFLKIANAVGIHGKNISEVMKKLGDDVRKAWEIITKVIAAAMPVIVVIMGIIGKVIAETFTIAFDIIIPLIIASVAIIKGIIIAIIAVVQFMEDAISGKGGIVPRMIHDVVAFFIAMAFPIQAAIVAVKLIILGTWTLIKDVVVPIVKLMWSLLTAEFHIGYTIIKGVIQVIYDVLTGKWSAIGTTIKGVVSDIWSTIKSTFDKAKTYLQTIFNGVGGFFKTAFGDVKDIITAPINALLGALHAVLHAIGQVNFHVPSVNTHIPGVGKLGGFDFGLPDLSSRIPTHLASGGTVPATPTGLLALLGEGGQRERIEPLDPSGMSRRDRAMIETIITSLMGGKSGQPIQIDVHPSAGMDEREVALQTSRELAWRLGA